MNKKWTIPILCVGVSCNALAKVDNREIAKCATIKGDLQRLECYDGIARKNGLMREQEQPLSTTGNGKWNVRSTINPVDDSKTVTLSLFSDSGQGKWGDRVYLIIRCKSDTTDLYINWNDYLGSEAHVLTRIGSAKASTAYWLLSTDKKATFKNKPISFIKKMMESNKMVAQVTPYNENPVTAVFDTTGLKSAIAPLRATCHW
ncbi:type VI secretion protein [Vibrio diabolicus]|uniref:type VI secretion protein n=1 Tax=Vibrio diabolicus TaxID=50719 RepID=UPI00211B42F5|nr:type VI secretion protein [Vibrio diabolicus]